MPREGIVGPGRRLFWPQATPRRHGCHDELVRGRGEALDLADTQFGQQRGGVVADIEDNSRTPANRDTGQYGGSRVVEDVDGVDCRIGSDGPFTLDHRGDVVVEYADEPERVVLERRSGSSACAAVVKQVQGLPRQ